MIIIIPMHEVKIERDSLLITYRKTINEIIVEINILIELSSQIEDFEKKNHNKIPKYYFGIIKYFNFIMKKSSSNIAHYYKEQSFKQEKELKIILGKKEEKKIILEHFRNLFNVIVEGCSISEVPDRFCHDVKKIYISLSSLLGRIIERITSIDEAMEERNLKREIELLLVLEPKRREQYRNTLKTIINKDKYILLKDDKNNTNYFLIDFDEEELPYIKEIFIAEEILQKKEQ